MRAARWVVGLAAFVSAFAVQAVTFTPCGATGAQGPDQGMCDTAYGGGVVSVSGGIQSWTVPASGAYLITATGAQGAAATSGTFVGGRGARITGTFNLTAGQVLQLVVGQAGSGNGTAENGGGGGGSFVVNSGNNPMLIAGGGGGTRESANQSGCDASVTQFAIAGSGDVSTSPCTVKTTDLGLGGQVSASSWGSGAAGFNGDGVTDTDCDNSAGGGLDWAHGMLGGDAANGGLYVGGFGGGGDGTGCNGGGGGGGYSGGDGGFIAGGGGSFNSGTSPGATTGIGTGNGSIVIVSAVAPVVAPIPALSPWGLIVLAGLLALTTVVVARRTHG